MADKTVTFTANASDSDGTIASIAWNFGDSATATGASVTHLRRVLDLHRREHGDRQRWLDRQQQRRRLHGDDSEPDRRQPGNGTVSINAGATYELDDRDVVARRRWGPNPRR